MVEMSVFGVGYTGNGKYKAVDEHGKITKPRSYWGNMLKRCYSEKHRAKNITYEECYVNEQWHNFQRFAEWFDNNYYEIPGEKMCLDKDILIKGNKEYGPETCCFVPERINQIFIKRQNDRGDCPIGVRKRKNKKYEARCNVYENGKAKSIYLGLYDSVEEAFSIYKQFKEQYIKQVAEEYKNRIPEKLYNALYAYVVEIND